MIDFAEFLMLLSILAGEAEETSSIKKVKLGQVSFYSRSALIRWIRNDGEEVNGDVTGPLIGPVRSAARGVALHKGGEMFFYSAIVVAGTVSGIQTYPRFANSVILSAIEWITLIIFAVEMVMKFLAESEGNMRYFLDQEKRLLIFGEEEKHC